jgi:hypothetical protein
MTYLGNFCRVRIPLLPALVFVFVVWCPLVFVTSESGRVAAQDTQASTHDQELASLRAEVERLKTLVPDQAHAMQDVGFHFTNLWFAAREENWPLAAFYLAETRSHLKWAVNIIPVRKTAAGDVDLRAILEAVDGSLLAAVKDSIDKQDGGGFATAYRQTIEGCYACHKASEKPFLHPRVPEAPAERIMNFDPGATWPQ